MSASNLWVPIFVFLESLGPLLGKFLGSFLLRLDLLTGMTGNPVQGGHQTAPEKSTATFTAAVEG